MAKKFTWGPVVERYVVGPYEIVKYHPKGTDGATDYGSTNYHGYIDGQDTHTSWNSIDEALVGLIVERHVGQNSWRIGAHFIAGLQGLSK